MAQHAAAVTPRRFRLHDSELACDVTRVYAYRAKCACCWTGPNRSSHALAREDGKDHRAEMQMLEAGEAIGRTEAS